MLSTTLAGFAPLSVALSDPGAAKKKTEEQFRKEAKAAASESGKVSHLTQKKHVGCGLEIRNGATGAVHLPKMLVLTIDDFVFGKAKPKAKAKAKGGKRKRADEVAEVEEEEEDDEEEELRQAVLMSLAMSATPSAGGDDDDDDDDDGDDGDGGRAATATAVDAKDRRCVAAAAAAAAAPGARMGRSNFLYKIDMSEFSSSSKLDAAFNWARDAYVLACVYSCSG